MQNDDSMIIQKETNEAKEILKDYFAKEQKKITRIPFYRLEEAKKIEEKKLKNIHKTEKKEKEKTNQLMHKKSLIERRKTKKTKKQRENLSSKHQKNINNEIETSSFERSETPNSLLLENQRASFSNKNSNDNTPIYLRKNNPNIMHDLKYSQITVFPSKREMRLSKKQQRLQNAENTIGSFLTPENKIQISNLMNKEKKNSINSVDYNNINKNENSKNYYYKNKQNGFKHNYKSDTKLYHVPFDPIFEPDEKNDINNEENDFSFSNEDNDNYDDNISLDEEKDIIEEKKEEHEDEKSEEHKNEDKNDDDKNNNEVKFGELKKKHKRLSKFKKAVLKYRLQKKKYLYNKIFNEHNYNNERNQIELKNENNNNHLKDNENKDNKNTIKNNDYHIFQNSSLFDYYNNLNQSDDYDTKYNNQINNYYYYFNNDYPYNYSLNNSFMNNQYNQYYYFNPSNKFSFETFINEKKTKIKENNFVYGISNQIDNKLKLNNEKKIYPEPGKILIMDLQKKIKENENKEAQLFTFENNKNQNNEIEKDNQEKEITKEEINNNFAKFKENLNKEYQFDTLDIDNLNGKELNDYLKKHKNIDKITIKQLKTILPKEDFEEYMKNFEGIENPKQKHLIREYVDQILDNKLDEKFSNFIIKLRDLYYKKKTNAPLKAKKRFVVGMREIEKYLKLKELLCLFIVPNIEKVKDEKNSLDLRILDIINKCRTNEIPILFGLNKYKLGKISRKKISCVSMLGIVDVKGLEKELKDIVEYGEHFRRDWYIKNYNNKEQFKDNQYILMDTFDYYHNQLENSKEEKI